MFRAQCMMCIAWLTLRPVATLFYHSRRSPARVADIPWASSAYVILVTLQYGRTVLQYRFADLPPLSHHHREQKFTGLLHRPSEHRNNTSISLTCFIFFNTRHAFLVSSVVSIQTKTLRGLPPAADLPGQRADQL